MATNLTVLIGDVLSLLGVPFGGTISNLLQKEIESRKRIAADILLNEIKRGDFSIISGKEIHEAIPMMLRYGRAAIEGSARLNLRLMAQVLAGKMVSSDFAAEKFLAYADALASLQRNEIILLATMQREIDQEIKNRNGIYGAEAPAMWDRVAAILIPSIFQNEDEMRATVTSASRTGLVMMEGNIDAMGFWVPSPSLDELIEMIDLDAALDAETSLNQR